MKTSWTNASVKKLQLAGARCWGRAFIIGLLLAITLPPASGLAKQFVDNLVTDFYAGSEDNILIRQNLDGSLILAPYAMLGNWTTTKAPSNTSLYLTASTSYNGKLYLVGGYGSADTTSISGPQSANALNRIWYGTILSDGSVEEWKEVDENARLPQPTYGHSVVAVNNRLYVIGGRSTANETMDSVYWGKLIGHDGSIKAYYRTNTWTAVASLPMPLFRAAAVHYEGRIYVIGGQDNADQAQDVVLYANVQPNGDINAWTRASAVLPLRLSGHNALQSNGRIYVLGGSVTGEPLDAVSDVYVGTIDPNSGDVTNWATTTSLPNPLYGAAAAITAGKIWVSGGISSGTAKSTVFFARIDRVSGMIPAEDQRDTWNRTTDLPVAVYNHRMMAFNGNLFILGGNNNAGLQNRVYSAALVNNRTNIRRWIPTTPLFLTPYGGGVYDIWSGHTAELRVPLPGDETGVSSGAPRVFVIGGGPNTFSAYTDGNRGPTDPIMGAYNTVFNSEVDAGGALQTWAAPETGGSIPIASILHTSTISNGSIYVVGGANSLNAFIWNGAASRSTCAFSQLDLNGIPCQVGKTLVFYEQVGQGTSSGGAGTFDVTASIPIFDPIMGTTGDANYQTNTATPIYQPLIRSQVVSHNGNLYVLGGISRRNVGWGAGPGADDVLYSTPVYENRVWFCRPNPGGTINEGDYLGNTNSGGAGMGAGGWMNTVPLPMALYDHTALVAYDRIYVIGGKDQNNFPQNAVYFATVNADATIGPWNATESMPMRLGEHAAVFTSGKIFVTGGINELGNTLNTVYYATPSPLDGQIPVFPAPGSWQPSTTTLEYPVSGHSLVANNGFLYLLGGRYRVQDPHTSSTYMTSIMDMYQVQDIIYSWAGNYERYIDFESDQMMQTINWDGDPNSETLQVKCRYALENSGWSAWENEQAVGPFIINRFAKYLHYKVHFETATNEAASVYRSPMISRVVVDFAASKRLADDSFLINHNRFDPQTENLLVAFKTRDHAVSEVILRVYNLEGELIRRYDATIGPNVPLPFTGSWTWDGTNENNEPVANGVYIIQYNSGNTHKIRKVVLFKR